MKKVIFLLVAAVLVFTGCSLTDDETEKVEMSELVISDDFNFSTLREVTVDVEVLYNGTFTIEDMKGNVIHKSLLKINSDEYTIEIPVHIRRVILKYDEVEHLQQEYEIINNRIETSFIEEENA